MFELDVKSKARLNQLYPDVASRLLAAYEAHYKLYGMKLFIIEAVRTFDTQNERYQQGRKTPGKIVTNSKAGESRHHYGIAFDTGFVGDPYLQKLTVEDPDQADSIWEDLGECFEEAGLVWGGRWKVPVDKPHCEMRYGNLKPLELYSLVKEKGGLCAAWEKFDTLLGIKAPLWGEDSNYKPASLSYLKGEK